MNYEYSEITYPSKDGSNTVTAQIYFPKGESPKGIVQLSHGMIDHVGRYKNLAEFLTANGYIFAGNDHLGHGKTAKDEKDYGFFASKNGYELVLRDLHSFNKILRERYPDLPIVMLGHSMGSFLARLYAAKYPHTVCGVIIHGTAGKNPLINAGLALTGVIKSFKGERHRSKLVTAMSVGAYSKKFPKSEGEFSWLSRDASMVSDKGSDPYANFTFTLSGYTDLFKMLKKCNSATWFKSYPKDMPTVIMSGESDPVGDFGKGPNSVYKQLLIEGCTGVSLKLYKDARHELFNEYCRDEAFSDILTFLERVTK